MMTIIYAVTVLAVIGAFCAAALLLASKYMSEPEDENQLAIRDALPGANCGACGYAGCDGYAAALAKGEEAKTNLCVPGGNTTAQTISAVLGVEASNVVEKVAFVRCMGDCVLAKQKYHYTGVESCRAARLLYGGKWACRVGCLGYGDCAAACPNDAISLVNGIAKVDTKKCTGCGLCASICPGGIIAVFPDVKRVLVTCSNTEKGAVARQNCQNACIGCKKCERACPHGAVYVENNLAHIDYDKCENCLECAKACPVGCIKIADFSGIHKYIVT